MRGSWTPPRMVQLRKALRRRAPTGMAVAAVRRVSGGVGQDRWLADLDVAATLRGGTTWEVGTGPSTVHERFFRWDEGSGYR